jgi:transposase
VLGGGAIEYAAAGARRIKTDRRDSMKLAGLARAGELSAIYVPDPADEAMRDLVRTREDAVAMQRQARHRLAALLLRNDIRYVGKTAWIDAHRRWLARLTLPQPAQRIAFEEYVQAVSESSERVQRLTRAMEGELEQWRWRPVVNALQACRGIQRIHAIRIVAELGDLSRFRHPRELMCKSHDLIERATSDQLRFTGRVVIGIRPDRQRPLKLNRALCNYQARPTRPGGTASQADTVAIVSFRIRGRLAVGRFC